MWVGPSPGELWISLAISVYVLFVYSDLLLTCFTLNDDQKFNEGYKNLKYKYINASICTLFDILICEKRVFWDFGVKVKCFMILIEYFCLCSTSDTWF